MVTRKVSLLPRPITKLLPFVLMGVLGWVWVLSEPSHFAAHPRVFCFAFGFLFCQMICNLVRGLPQPLQGRVGHIGWERECSGQHHDSPAFG